MIGGWERNKRMAIGKGGGANKIQVVAVDGLSMLLKMAVYVRCRFRIIAFTRCAIFSITGGGPAGTAGSS